MAIVYNGSMSLGALFIVYLVGLVSPGPDTVLALSTTATHNRRAGLLTVLGFMVGVTTVMTLVLCLLTFFESSGVQLMLGIKVLGACYLGTLGLMAFIRPPRFSTTSHVSRRGTFFLQGLLCNITNPKTQNATPLPL